MNNLVTGTTILLFLGFAGKQLNEMANCIGTTDKHVLKSINHVGKICSINEPDITDSAINKIGVYTEGTWYLDLDTDGKWNSATDRKVDNFGKGLYNAKPVMGDWTGKGEANVGVYTEGTWYLDRDGDGKWNPAADRQIDNFGKGLPNAKPVVGNWTGKGEANVGVYAEGTWYLDLDGDGKWNPSADRQIYNFGKGVVNAQPVVGEWTGNGQIRVGVYSDGIWYLDIDGDGKWKPAVDRLIDNFGKGVVNAQPVVGDWTGNGQIRVGVYSDGIWYLDIDGDGKWRLAADRQISNLGKGLSNSQPVIF